MFFSETGYLPGIPVLHRINAGLCARYTQLPPFSFRGALSRVEPLNGQSMRVRCSLCVDQHEDRYTKRALPRPVGIAASWIAEFFVGMIFAARQKDAESLSQLQRILITALDIFGQRSFNN